MLVSVGNSVGVSEGIAVSEAVKIAVGIVVLVSLGSGDSVFSGKGEESLIGVKDAGIEVGEFSGIRIQLDNINTDNKNTIIFFIFSFEFSIYKPFPLIFKFVPVQMHLFNDFINLKW